MELNNTTIGLIILGIIVGLAMIFGQQEIALTGSGAIAGVVTGNRLSS